MSASPSSRPVNSRLLTSGAVLVGVGGMIATAGLTLGSAAVLGAARRWQQGTEMTPAPCPDGPGAHSRDATGRVWVVAAAAAA